MNSRPLFSILHPSARPDQWRKIYEAWIGAAVHPEDVQYVLCTDERWGFSSDWEKDGARLAPNAYPVFRQGQFDQLVWNTGRRCYVDSVNTAAKAATGQILIVIADDQWPSCQRWDEALVGAIERLVGNQYGSDPARWPEGVFSNVRTLWPQEFVIAVSTGTPQEHERGIMVMPILSRARYERLGYIFYPEYESMYADNDFCEHAKQDGVVIDARHLMFPHRHFLFNEKGEWGKSNVPEDAAYRAQNRAEAYTLGKKLLERRRAVKFNGIAPEAPSGPPCIAVCMPGEHFSVHWVAAWTELFTHLLQKGFRIAPCFNYTSNVYFTRQSLSEMLQQATPPVSHILWFDDDQILTPANFDRLWERMQQCDMVAGWTWIQDDQLNVTQVSAGKYSADDSMVTFIPRSEMERVQKLGQLVEVEWTGFPAVLMKADVLMKASENAKKRNGIANPFAPLPAPNSRWGFTGEDISFCVNAKDAGVKIYVDAGAFIPHLKLRQVVAPPIIPASNQDWLRSAMDRPLPSAQQAPEERKSGRVKRVVEALMG